MPDQQPETACPDGHAWSTHLRPGSGLPDIRTCMMCHEIDWDGLAEQVETTVQRRLQQPGGICRQCSGTGTTTSGSRTPR